MTQMQLNAELLRNMSIIAEDENMLITRGLSPCDQKGLQDNNEPYPHNSEINLVIKSRILFLFPILCFKRNEASSI